MERTKETQQGTQGNELSKDLGALEQPCNKSNGERNPTGFKIQLDPFFKGLCDAIACGSRALGLPTMEISTSATPCGLMKLHAIKKIK